MIWRGLAVGPALGGGTHAAWDVAAGCPVAVRWFAHAPAVLPAYPWPAEPTAHLARCLRLERSGTGAVAVSELALGPSLALLLERPQPPPIVAGLCAQALSALEELHRAGRVHGRIHPGNLVLDVDAACVRLLDLAARALEGVPPPGDERRLFLAPGSATRDPVPADDIYAVGRVAEALLRGGPPLLRWEPLPLGRADRGEAAFAHWIARCQALDPGQGFADAAAAREALRAFAPEAGATFARVPAGPWLAAHRRTTRAVRKWRKGVRPGRDAAQWEDVLSSFRATRRRRRFAVAAGATVLVGATLALVPPLPSASREALSPRARTFVDAVAGALQRPDAGATPPGDPLEAVWLDPAAKAVLAVQDAAVLPEPLAQPLRDLESSTAAFAKAEKPCAAKLSAATAESLAAVQPGAPPAVARAVEALAARRLAGEVDPREEAALRQSFGVAESPMLDRVLDEVTGNAELGRCVAGLQAPADGVAEALEACREKLAPGLSLEALAPSAAAAP